ncbi:MAG: glycine zipper 2TM domain-containing protein [Novosphingobium sp.]
MASLTLSAPLAADPPLYTFGGGNTASGAIAYDANGNYVTPQTLGENDRVWVGEDGQYHCKRKNGTTGLVIGAAIGGFLGNRIAGRGKRTLGTIIGAVGGGLLGKSLTDGEVKCQ